MRRVIIHVHRTADAASKAKKIEDLANRMAAALEELMGWQRTHDDDVGHAFHGNQWTGGISGPKPTTMQGKSAFVGIKGLLQSGHSFSKEELLQITGLKPKKLSDYLAMLKNPKWAGAGGALEIVKNPDGTYQAQVKGDVLEAGLAAAEAAEKEQQSAIAAAEATSKALAAAEEKIAAALAAQKKKEQEELLAKVLAEEAATEAAKLSPAEIKAALAGINIPGIENQQAKLAIKNAKELAGLGDVAGIQAHADQWATKKAPKTKLVMANLLAAMKGKQAALPQGPAKAPEQAQAPDLATPGSVSKVQADATYQASLGVATATLVTDLKGWEGTKDSPFKTEAYSKALLAFKNAKAAGMAKWAHDVHGTAFNPTPQAVFKSDLQLAKDLGTNGDTVAEAMAKWKHNTNLEKQGMFPPANPTYTHAAPVKPAKPEPVVPHVDMKGKPEAVPVVPYASLVPAKFQPIDGDDLKKNFPAGISKFKSFLEYDQSSGAVEGKAQDNKKSVEQKLRDRLADKPNFQALVNRLGLMKSGTGCLESRLISAWAGSSGDSNDISVALQLAVRDAFGIPDGHVEKKQLHSLANQGGNEDHVAIAGIRSLNPNMKSLTSAEVPVAKAALREFVQAQYAETQEMLEKAGYDHVFLARGMKMNTSHDPNQGAAVLKLQPASSFSTKYSTAKSFAGSGGTVFITKVPRQQVLSTYVTGFGCTSEHEVVVLAHEKTRAFTVHATAAAGHIQAAEAVASKLKKG